MCRERKGVHVCTLNKSKFRHWAWYEWLTAIVLVFTLIYSVIGIVFTSMHLDSIVSKPKKVEHHVKLFHSTPPQYLLSVLLFGHCCLFVISIIGLIWLKYMRNLCIFLIIFVVLFVVMIIYFLVGAFVVFTIDNDEYLAEDMYNYVLRHIGYGHMKYELSFLSFQSEKQCCGVRGYEDWKEFGKRSIIDSGNNNSVPESCCKIRNGSCVSDFLSRCGLSADLDKINKRGCWDDIKKEYIPTYRQYAIESFIVAFCLLLLLILILYICHRLFLYLVRSRWRSNSSRNDRKYTDITTNGNETWTTSAGDGKKYTDRGAGPSIIGSGSRIFEGTKGNELNREVDAESYIVPGSPAKSLISDDEKTFYAP